MCTRYIKISIRKLNRVDPYQTQFESVVEYKSEVESEKKKSEIGLDILKSKQKVNRNFNLK